MPTLLAALLLLFALNGRLRARKIITWRLGVLATEFGAFFAPIAWVVAALAARSGLVGIPGVVFALAAAGLFLCPEFQSFRLCRKLPVKLRLAFGENAGSVPGRRAIEVSGGFRSLFGTLASWGNALLHRRTPAIRLTYPASGGVSRPVVFYPAPGPAPAPCVIMVHSGGWEAGSPEEFASCHRALAKSGYAVAAVGYGLARVFLADAARRRCAAIPWLKENAGSLGIRPDSFTLLGRSAGGQVALCVAYDDPDPAIRGVVSFYAPTDMVFSWRGAYDGDILESPRLLKNYLGGRPHETPETHAEASPTFHAAKRPVPTLLLHGGRDEIVRCVQARRLARILRYAGAPHLALVVPWGKHAFDYRFCGPGGRVAFRALTGFLAAVTKS